MNGRGNILGLLIKKILNFQIIPIFGIFKKNKKSYETYVGGLGGKKTMQLTVLDKLKFGCGNINPGLSRSLAN